MNDAMTLYVETLRATVAPSDCDQLGHMNIQHYFRIVSDGMFALMTRMGLGAQEICSRKLSFAVVRVETEFHRELCVGDVIALESTILKFGQKSATFGHRLRNIATDEVAMSADYTCVLLDLDKRQATVIPEDIRRAAAGCFPSGAWATDRL
jgi:acyl-CoA thioester hydrolase